MCQGLGKVPMPSVHSLICDNFFFFPGWVAFQVILKHTYIVFGIFYSRERLKKIFQKEKNRNKPSPFI